MTPLDQNTLDTLIHSRDFSNADPNDLAIAYMISLEGGIPNSKRFQAEAERALAANLMDIKQPVMDRLYADLVGQPILPILEPKSPLRVAMRIWGQKGEVYLRWVKLQNSNGLTPIEDTSTPAIAANGLRCPESSGLTRILLRCGSPGIRRMRN